MTTQNNNIIATRDNPLYGVTIPPHSRNGSHVQVSTDMFKFTLTTNEEGELVISPISGWRKVRFQLEEIADGLEVE